MIQVLRLQYEREQLQAHVTVQTKFNFAWGLVKSPLREHQVEGVRLLQGELSSYLLQSFLIMYFARLISLGAYTTKRMFILPGFRTL